MSGFLYPEDQLALGLRMSNPGGLTQPAGLGGLSPTTADAVVAQAPLPARNPGLLPMATTSAAAQAPAYYNRATNQMFAGGRAFDMRDVNSAFEAGQNLAPAAAPGAGWEPVSAQVYNEFLQGMSQRRGAGELLARGARNVAGGLVGGVGALAEMAGATEVGPAIQRAGDAITGQDEFDKQRSALIQRNSSLGANIVDAVFEGLPSVAASGFAALAGGLVAGPAGAAAGLSLARARTVGAVGGLFASSFPQQVNTFYEAAQNARTPDGQPAYSTSDPTVQATILGAAFGTTLLDVIAPGRVAAGLSKALTDRATEIGAASLQGMARARAVGGAAVRSGLEEAGTEALQTLTEQAVFDPEFRSKLTANDWKALAPYIVERYGENTLIAAGAGAVLGAGFGGAGRFVETRAPRDILTDAGSKPAEGQPATGGGEGTTIETPATGQPPAAGLTPPTSATFTTGMLGDVLTSGEIPSMEAAPAAQPVWDEQLGGFVAPSPPPPKPRLQQGPFTSGVLPSVGTEPLGPDLPSLAGMVTALPPSGPQFGPTRAPPNIPAPQFAPATPTRAPETFVTPEMERLRRPVPPAPAPATVAETDAGNRLLALRRQMELQQAQAQRAAQPQPIPAAERDYEAALTQVAIEQPITLDAEATSTGTNAAADNARRSIVGQFNGLTKAQQDEVLAGYDNDPAMFLERVRRMPAVETKRLRAQIDRIAATAASGETKLNATQVRQVKQGGVGQRKAVGKGGATPKTGGSNRIEQGGKKQAAAPKPLKIPPAKSSVETLKDEGITLSKNQTGQLNTADEQIKRYQAFLKCLGGK